MTTNRVINQSDNFYESELYFFNPSHIYCCTEITKISTAVPNTTEAEVGEEATEIADDNNPVKKKRESTRKKSIPILDQEHRMVPVNEVNFYNKWKYMESHVLKPQK